MVPQKSKKSKKSKIAVFGGSPKTEAVEKVELPCNSRPNLRRRKEGGGHGHGSPEVE